MGKQNQIDEIPMGIQSFWAAPGKWSGIGKNQNIQIHLKREVFDSYMFPVMTYGLETATLTI